MSTKTIHAELASALRRAVHPPVREGRFWVVQATVVMIAALHLCGAAFVSGTASNAVVGVSISLWILPVLYSALRYGLVGSAATSIWTVALWLPNLALPHGEGMPTCDIASLAVLVLIGFFVGHRIEVERLAHARVERATTERLVSEARYRQLFEANSAPILVLDDAQTIREANPAARAVLGNELIGVPGPPLLDGGRPLAEHAGQVLRLGDGRDYRVDIACLPDAAEASTQLILQDVTEERSKGRRAERYAALIVQAEEEQRRHLSRELHDEPLQLFLHLARRLESLGGTHGVPPSVASGLAQARSQALDAAARLRTLAQELRPPALDQLGLVAALSSLVADVEDESGLVTGLEVTGDEMRCAPLVELGAFRIVQEAVRNVLRHADAHRLQVTVDFGRDELGLVVEDDGRGFAAAELEELGSDHLGLLGMRERANLLGGEFEVRSDVGVGTVVCATMPLRARELAVV